LDTYETFPLFYLFLVFLLLLLFLVITARRIRVLDGCKYDNCVIVLLRTSHLDNDIKPEAALDIHFVLPSSCLSFSSSSYPSSSSSFSYRHRSKNRWTIQKKNPGHKERYALIMRRIIFHTRPRDASSCFMTTSPCYLYNQPKTWNERQKDEIFSPSSFPSSSSFSCLSSSSSSSEVKKVDTYTS